MFAALDALMAARLPQMELYCNIGRVVGSRAEKGAAVAASEYLQAIYPAAEGFSPRNLRRMRDFYRMYGDTLELLAEATTTEMSKQKAPSTFSENIAVAREGGEAAGIARKAVEERTGVPVITSKNAAQLNQVVTDLLEGAAADMSEMPEEK